MQCLDPSEQLAAIIIIGYAILLSVLAPRICTMIMIIVLQDVLKKLANVPKEATVREADLMSALQCGVGYNTPGLLLL